MAGPLASYNSLADQHLAEYYSRPTNFNHLRKMGLITSDGRVVDERVVKMRAARKEHQQQAKELLAGAIVNKAVELERKRRVDLKNKLELLAKYEMVERVKSQKRHPAGVQAFNPHHSRPASSPSLSASLDKYQEQLGLSMGQVSDLQQLARQTARAKSPHPHRPPSPYAHGRSGEWSLPASRTPSPSPWPRPPSATTGVGSSTLRKRMNRPSTAPPSKLRSSVSPHPLPSKTKIHSNVELTLCYVGTGLHLEGWPGGVGDSEVLVSQQHCGGNPVTRYRGRLKPKDNFTFTSLRHLGMPFGLTIFLDGMIDCRVSSCCEYKHQPGRLLGSKSAHFRLVGVTGGRPCYQCEGRERQSKRQTKGAASLKEPSPQVGGEREAPLHSEVLSRQPTHHSTPQLDSPTGTGQTASPESHSNLDSRRSKVESKHKGSANSTASMSRHSPQSLVSMADNQTDSGEAIPEDPEEQLYDYGEDFEDEQEERGEAEELLAGHTTQQESVQTPDSLLEERGSECVSSVEVSESEEEDTSVLVREASQIESQRGQDAQTRPSEEEIIKPDSVISIPSSLPPPERLASSNTEATLAASSHGVTEPPSETGLQTAVAHSEDLASTRSRGDSKEESTGSRKSSVSSSLTSLSTTTISSSTNGQQ